MYVGIQMYIYIYRERERDIHIICTYVCIHVFVTSLAYASVSSICVIRCVEVNFVYVCVHMSFLFLCCFVRWGATLSGRLALLPHQKVPLGMRLLGTTLVWTPRNHLLVLVLYVYVCMCVYIYIYICVSNNNMYTYIYNVQLHICIYIYVYLCCSILCIRLLHVLFYVAGSWTPRRAAGARNTRSVHCP